MKRILAFLLLSALLLTLCGCGSEGALLENDSPSTAPTAVPTRQPAAESTPAAAETPTPVKEPVSADVPAEQPAAAAALARASYPEMAPYPQDAGGYDAEAYNAWRKSLDAQRNQPEGYADGLEAYLRASLTEFLSGAGEDNRVCAPMNIYLCLAMLAELTDGESRAQVLALLGEKDVLTLRAKAKALWNAEYRDDGLVTCRLGSSVWLNQYVNYIQETLDILAENYYASSFRGQMGSPEYDQALRNWLNEQTGDLLKDQTSGLSMDARTVMALCTTIYFKAPWHDKFSELNTYAQTFHGAGGDEEADFLHRSFTGQYYWGEDFSAVSVHLESGGSMWFILPDEGKSPEDLLSGESMDFILSRNKYAWEKQKGLMIRFAAPRFDVSSDMDLISGLKNLGVRDVFDMDASDFTPMTADTDQIYISQVQHAARVMIDEEGCTGAAYTVMMMMAGSAMPPKESVDFVADRPFIFLVTGSDGLPLFTGIVNTTK